MSPSAPTVRSLDTRIDDLERSYLEFRSKIEVVVSLLKWTGGFVVVTLVTVIIQLISISYAAGRLQEKVDSQTSATKEMKAELQEMRQELREARKEIHDIHEEVSKLRRVP